MAVAALLTLLALCGVWAGVFLGRAGRAADQLAAAGGGLLFGIALFWVIPETAETVGHASAYLLAVSVALALALLDRTFMHTGQSASRGVVWPLLLATAIHSLLDGWSVRLLSLHPLTNVAVTAGLALHKIPEGLALGWVTRRSMGSAKRALFCSGAAELFTLVGAFAEPALNATGAARFGLWWTAGVLSVIAGGFLFLGIHAVLPAWRQGKVIAIFVATMLLVGTLTYFRSGIL